MDFQNYEFSKSQNELIKQLADKMRFVSYFSIAGGLLTALVGLVAITRGGFFNIIYGVVQIMIGIWTNNASSSFHRIVDTQGNDIENLMGALGDLRKLYVLQYWLLILAIVFVVIGIVTIIALGGIAGVSR